MENKEEGTVCHGVSLNVDNRILLSLYAWLF